MKHLCQIALAIVGAVLWPGGVSAQSQLTASELNLVREQIARCWNGNGGARDAKDLVVEIRVALNRDGTATRADIVDTGRAAADPLFRAAVERARRVFFNPNCTPLKLPPEKYEAWKDFVVDFSNPEGESSLASSIGPGFDCAKATQPLARLICANPELSKTDLRFNQAFQALRQHLDPAEQGQLQTQPPAPMIYAIFMCFAGAGTCNQLGFYHVAGDQMSQFFATKAECERSISDLIAEEKIAPDFDVRCLGRHVDTWQ